MKIYNTYTQRKENFRPMEAGKVRMYVCGLTTYDFAHLGHARMLVAFDVIVRYLRASGYQVTYVRNITDIDDKIIRRAHENREPFTALTERFIEATHEDERALNILPPDIEPRATRHLSQIIEMIEALEEKGYAYATENGDVYFSVHQFQHYGRLSRKDPEQLVAGSRVEVGEEKRDPRDFALWKAAKAGEPCWDSPWGFGRPGWHIECSAMSTCNLGTTFDIHGGGSDLLFPHHENEVAQSEAATGKKFVHYWMHNGPVRVDDEKMSKSLGNFFTVREVLRQYPAEVIRYFLISSHYRSAINYSRENLDGAYSALERIYNAMKGLDIGTVAPLAGSEFERKFRAAMDDDFNTPEALGVLFELVRELNRQRDEDPAKALALAALLKDLGGILGILQLDPADFLRQGADENVDPARVEELIAQRNRARAERNWAEADRIRDELKDMHVVLEDRKDGSTGWRVEH